MGHGTGDRVELRLRHVLEFGLVAVVAYFAIHVGPVLVLRVRFLNEMQLAANSPVQVGALEIKQHVHEIANSAGIVLLSENLHVERNPAAHVTLVDANYKLHINFWPGMVYEWDVHDRVEALLY